MAMIEPHICREQKNVQARRRRLANAEMLRARRKHCCGTPTSKPPRSNVQVADPKRIEVQLAFWNRYRAGFDLRLSWWS